jgi:Family of unknown function (DUF5518)
LDANTTTKWPEGATKAGYGQPALIGGLVMGVLSALPLISAANFCCCLWVVSGGLVAAYLLQQNQTLPITAGDGALVGLVAGVIGAFVMFVLSIPIGMLVEPMQRAMAQRVLDMAGPMPPFFRQILQNQADPNTDIGMVSRIAVRMFVFFFFLIAGSIFSTLGGLLGVALFKKKVFPISQPQDLPNP